MMDELRQIIIGGFEITDLGVMNYFLGLEVKQCDHGSFISQGKYVMNLIEKFNRKDCNSVKTPMKTAIRD